MSRKYNEEPLNLVIDRMLKAYGLEEGYYEAAIVTHWEKMMGSAVARLTRSVKLSKGVLTISLDSAALRQELSFSKDQIVQAINKEVLPDLVKEVRLL